MLLGQWEYDFSEPRGNAEGLAESFSNMNLDNHQGMDYYQGSAYTHDVRHGVDGTAAASVYHELSMQPSQSTSHTKARTKPADSRVKSKGKDKGASKKHQSAHPKNTGNGGAKDAGALLEPFYRKPAPSDSDPASQYANPNVASDLLSHDPAYASKIAPISGAETGYNERTKNVSPILGYACC